MTAIVRRISGRTEFTVVILASLGYLITGSVWLMFRSDITAQALSVTQQPCSMVGYRLAVMTGVIAFLSLRGWNLRDFPLRVNLRQTMWGAGLFLSVFTVYVAGAGLSRLLLSEKAMALYSFGGCTVNLPNLIAVAVVNPLFEELLILGYVIRSLKIEHTVWFTINASVLLRVLCHLNQGVYLLAVVIPMGLVFGHYFYRRNNLWPPILGHSLMSLVFLAA